MVTRRYRRVDEISWAPESEVQLRELDRSPEIFDADLDAEGPVRHLEDELLVDLEVAETRA